MKLSELNSMLDPRKPLRLAPSGTPSRTVTVRTQPAGARVRAARNSSSAASIGDELDLTAIDRAIATITQQTGLVGRGPLYWRQAAVRLHQRPRLGELRQRGARVADLFTGAATGVLTALWQQESEQQRALRHAALSDQWALLRQLRAQPGSAERAEALLAMRVALVALRTEWLALEQFDELDRAMSSGVALALSPGAAAGLAARTVVPRGRLERSFQRRADWGAGVVWLPDRRVLLAWSSGSSTSGTDQTLLYEIDAADLAAWVHSLQTATPGTLDWRTWSVPAAGRLTDDEPWAAPATEVAQLLLLGQSPTPSAERPSRAVGAGRAVPPLAPVDTAAPMTAAGTPVTPTRYLITTTDARTGVEPFALATGDVPTTEWIRARWRQTWSAEQCRYVRTWTDAYAKDTRRASHDPVLVTVLP